MQLFLIQCPSPSLLRLGVLGYAQCATLCANCIPYESIKIFEFEKRHCNMTLSHYRLPTVTARFIVHAKARMCVLIHVIMRVSARFSPTRLSEMALVYAAAFSLLIGRCW